MSQATALSFTITLVAVVLAGCIGGNDLADSQAGTTDARPVVALKCFDQMLSTDDGSAFVEYEDWGEPLKLGPDGNAMGPFCNQEMTPDTGRAGNEVTIAVNPTDPNNIVGGAKDYYPDDAGECVWDGVYVTHDGGQTWEDRSFDGSPWRLRNGDTDNFVPNYATQFWCTTDPVAYFDVNGNLYYLLMAYQADPVTGSKTGEEELPNGALNDWAFNRATQIVAVSDDGGDTFHTFTPVLEGTFPVNFHDKGWLAASEDGTIHVMWLAFFVPGNQYCRSTDAGQSYVCSEIIAPQFIEAGQGSFLEVGTGGQVYATWYNGGIWLKKSDDHGETWGEAGKVLDTNPQSMPGLSARDRRTGYPMIATDRNPESPQADAVYAVWNDACTDAVWAVDCTEGNNSIYFSASFDEGDTWTQAIRIDGDVDDQGELLGDHWSIFPAVSVSPGGVIDVTWMDTRGARWLEGEDGDPYATFEQYYTYSTDGGKTWATAQSLRDADDGGWDPALSYHQNGMVFIGDYNDIDSSWGAAHPVWPDTRHGVADVYTAVVQRPLFADGWPSDERAAKAQALVDAGLVEPDHPWLE